MKDNFISLHIESAVERLLKKADVSSVLVAVSGGADSVALLYACCHIAPRLNLRVEAVNCNFHLRGSESDRDSQFTAGICMRLGVKLHSLDYDVDSYIQSHPGVSVEMACRELRYSDFFRIMEEEGFDRVAVAHNSDDDIETMLLNMLRGSGSRGLKGMDKDTGRILRPLLGVSRNEIESYLESAGIGYVMDSSNMTIDYRRNFIRREVLPLLEKRWKGARKSLMKTIRIMKDESSIVEDYYRRELSRLRLSDTCLDVYAKGITTGVVWRFLEPFGGNPVIAEEILKSIDKDFSERTWKLSERHNAVLERNHLKIVVADVLDENIELKWEILEMNGEVMQQVKGNKSHESIYLPAGEHAYELRLPGAGDRLAPLGMKGTRLVSDIISDAKLSRENKSRLRVLIRKSDGEIIWVTGLKRSRHDLITGDCPVIYKATYQAQFQSSVRKGTSGK